MLEGVSSVQRSLEGAMRYRIGDALRMAPLVSCLACGHPAEDPLLARELALDDSRCSLGSECERWGTLMEDAPALEATCITDPAATATPVVWFQPLAGASCPFGQCELYDQQLSLDTDGSLITLAAVTLPSQYGWTGSEGGLWFTRHSATGRLLSSALSDFSAPPPGIEIERHGALLRDGTGRALFVSSRAVLPFSDPRVLQVSGLSRSLARGAPVFSAPPGWGVLAAPSGANEWVVAANRPVAERRTQASVARYDRRGRALWNRSWPEGSAAQALQVTRDQAIAVLVSDAASSLQTLYWLDKRGVVAWRRMVGGPRAQTQMVATGDGGLFLTVHENDFQSSLQILKIAADGQLAAWAMPELMFPVPSLSTDEAGHPMLALPSYSAAGMPTLDWFSFDEGVCQRTSYQWPSASSFVFGRVAVQADRRGARFFASTDMIGQLRERGEP
jgi:hypothetical protein